MRLSCLDCGAEFRVDPRARTRTFRVACRRCGAPIVHRGHAYPDAAVWHVSIAGETVGPLRSELVIDLLERGTLGVEPLIWRDGFVAWRALSDLEQFADRYFEWMRRREATAVLELELSSDPDAPEHRTPVTVDAEPLATRPRGAVEFVVADLDEAVPTPIPRVSRLQPTRDDTGVYSLALLQQATQPPASEVPELPAFSPAALAAVALPPDPVMPAAPAPIPATPLPKPAPAVGLYVMLFVLMVSIGGLGALVLFRDREPVLAAETTDATDLESAAMARDEAPPLPSKPTRDELEAALAAVRSDARRCGPKHGAAPGTKVEVALAVAGDGGRVLSVVAEPPHAVDPLGRCVADALARASFPSFRKRKLSLRYAVSM